MSLLLTCAATLVFLVHAANYLYFFVDDEAIPFVYAQNVLEGRGLVYNPSDGRVEGYSDFLHIWLSAAVLAVTRAADLPKISVFFVGKAVSLACGVAMLWATAGLLRSAGGIGPAGFAAGLGAVALAGPLAVWSCSSLEAVPFALLFVLLVRGVARCGESARTDVLTAMIAIAVVLERIDGFLYAGAAIVAFGALAPPATRSLLVRRIAVPVAVACVAYHGWRLAWYGSLLPLPLEAKVWFKLASGKALVRKIPDRNYVTRFLEMYAFVPVLIVGVAAYAARHRPPLLAVVITTILLVAYVGVVGDWMFGFRFFVPLLPLFAVFLGVTMSVAGRRAPAVGAVLTGVVLIGAGVAAYRFERQYEQHERRPSWIRSPREGPTRYFAPYYETATWLAPRIRPGDTMAFNQAGLLPFLLDVPNIDNLGICTPFFARLPTPDVYFTEVGRYSPLTNRPALRAADAYLLYRRPTYIVEPGGLIRSANGGLPPASVLDGRYHLLLADRQAVYRVAPGELFEEFRRDPTLFRENLAHLASARRIRVNGATMPAEEAVRACPFLGGDRAWVTVNGSYELEVDLAGDDVPVNAFFLHDVRARDAITLSIGLYGRSGEARFLRALDVQRGGHRSIYLPFDEPPRVHRLRVLVNAQGAGPTAVRLEDLRLQGQSPGLAQFVRRSLSFAR